MTPDTPVTVTAIVVGYNHAHCLGRCFDSLMGSQGLAELQVIYVDNASEDSSVAATSWHDPIQVVRNPHNVGFAAAVNQGVALARGHYVALVNPDTAIGPECLRALVDHLRRHPEVGLVGPILLDEEGHQQVSLAPYPGVGALARRWLRRRADPGQTWLVGALVMAETALLQQLGGLDEKYFVYGEDMDLSFRVQQAGKQVRVERSVHIRHTGNPRWSPERLVRVYGAYLRFAADHMPRQRALLGAVLSGLWVARGRWGGARRQALADGLRRIWSTARDQAPTERFY